MSTSINGSDLAVPGTATIATLALTNPAVILRPYRATGVNYPATLLDEIIELTATGLTVTLPTPVGCAGKEFLVKLTAATSSGTVATAAGSIEGVPTYSLTAQDKYVRVFSNGTDWLISGSN
jgi:hypothetical protein